MNLDVKSSPKMAATAFHGPKGESKLHKDPKEWLWSESWTVGNIRGGRQPVKPNGGWPGL